jgi:hypothetical protein
VRPIAVFRDRCFLIVRGRITYHPQRRSAARLVPPAVQLVALQGYEKQQRLTNRNDCRSYWVLPSDGITFGRGRVLKSRIALLSALRDSKEQAVP